MNTVKKVSRILVLLTIFSWSTQGATADLNLADTPLFVGTSVPPLSMIVMGRDHKLYYEAYNDASDLDGDGVVDVGYKPSIDYYGYFDSYKCYTYGSEKFTPSNTTANKKCSGKWSGDFLNYITTARIDALRKVLYGGYRDVDTDSSTVLQRTHVPQDAHSWGKEYDPALSPGYAITDYTPLAEPATGTRHLFANVSLSYTGEPLLRVLNNSTFRVWNWLSKERPVAGSDCVNSSGSTVACTTSSTSDTWEVVPDTVLKDLVITTYDISSYDGSNHPSSHSDYNDWFNHNYTSNPTPKSAISKKSFGSGSILTINGSNNPYGSDDNYLTVINGKIVIPEDDNYTFSVDGDDAVEFIIDPATKHYVVGFYGGHGTCNCNTHQNTFYLEKGEYPVQFRHEERGGGDSYVLRWKTSKVASTMTDYAVNVEVCKTGLLEANCKSYPDGNYKPTGLLHQYGENDSMMFGLLSGSYENNTQGGVLRKRIGSITDEIDPDDGTFTSTVGIVKTIDRLRTYGFDYNSKQYDCGWITTRAINNGECPMWGNPIGEMLYESMRYFSGVGSPLSTFDYTDSGSIDNSLGLPKASWNDPYNTSDNGFNYCAKPFQLVISDINPSYDSDKIPGSYFSGEGTDSAVPGLDAKALADTITSGESDVVGMKFIGQSNAVSDSSPEAKDVTSLGTVRGLAPEEPTKLGSYYVASAAYFGWLNDISDTTAEPTELIAAKDSRFKQKPNTFTVALASPLPNIKIPLIGGGYITLVPFAKSPGGASISSAASAFQPTNQIVDFYVESLSPTTGSFLINFEDVEQGADHDMDAIARYTYTLNADNTVTITVDSIYAAGGIDQHMGYVISGTTKDGVYLEVKDIGGRDINYYLDTPAGIWADDSRGTTNLGLSATRIFTPSGAASASFLNNPLWYAAKWGGFVDQNDNDKPDLSEEWDSDADGDPDNYFLVTNALGLSAQLEDAFDEILARSGSSATVTVNSGALGTETLLFQALFDAEYWTGSVLALPVQSDGSVVTGSEVWDAKSTLKAQSDNSGYSTNRAILTYKPSTGKGIPFRWPSNYLSPGTTDLDAVQIAGLLTGVSADYQDYGSDLLDFIRGSSAQEQGESSATRMFRSRSGYVLGDIVHSDPVYVPNPGFFYADSWEAVDGLSAPENAAAQTYSDFRQTFANRQPVLYFGANDGMFHGINAWASTSSGGGNEVLAYVPTQVYKNLGDLASTDYNHQYYVDGPATYGDAFFHSTDNKWHTVIVGTLRAGGQGVFALDVSDPQGTSSSYPDFNETDAADVVLWEFDDTDDSDLGYVFGRPSIVRMANGRWAAIFGNGYNNTESDGHASSTGNAILYIVDIATGSIIKKLSTEAGRMADPTGAGRPNGLAAPTAIDVNDDNIADYIYAGDLFGNVWKFDVSSATSSSWDSAFHSSGHPAPLYVAEDTSGNALPITTKVQVGTHPEVKDEGNYMVFFGTGQYMEANDNLSVGELTQSFHGIWDSGERVTSRSKLLRQSIVKEISVNNSAGEYIGNYREVSDEDIVWEGSSAHKGWVIDLVNTDSGSNNYGERQISNAILRNDRIIFTTLIPSEDICEAGGSGWIMELDAENGGALDNSPFDTDGDGDVDKDDKDLDNDGKPDTVVAGFQPGGATGGIPSAPAIIDAPQLGYEVKEVGTSTGNIESILEDTSRKSTDRQSWREVQ